MQGRFRRGLRWLAYLLLYAKRWRHGSIQQGMTMVENLHFECMMIDFEDQCSILSPLHPFALYLAIIKNTLR